MFYSSSIAHTHMIPFILHITPMSSFHIFFFNSVKDNSVKSSILLVLLPENYFQLHVVHACVLVNYFSFIFQEKILIFFKFSFTNQHNEFSLFFYCLYLTSGSRVLFRLSLVRVRKTQVFFSSQFLEFFRNQDVGRVFYVYFSAKSTFVLFYISIYILAIL